MLYKATLGLSEIAVGVLLAVPSFDPQATFARLSAEELREDPGDRFVALVTRHLPSLLHHRGLVAVGLIMLGLAKLVAAAAMWEGHEWGGYLLAGTVALLLPFDLRQAIVSPREAIDQLQSVRPHRPCTSVSSGTGCVRPSGYRLGTSDAWRSLGHACGPVVANSSKTDDAACCRRHSEPNAIHERAVDEGRFDIRESPLRGGRGRGVRHERQAAEHRVLLLGQLRVGRAWLLWRWCAARCGHTADRRAGW